MRACPRISGYAACSNSDLNFFGSSQDMSRRSRVLGISVEMSQTAGFNIDRARYHINIG